MTCGSAQGPGGACEPALNFNQLESLWVQAGGAAALAALMAGIALAESGGVPNNNNYTDNGGTQTSWGLWQLSDGTHNEYVPGIGTDPAANASAAVAKYQSQGIGAWQGDAVYQAWSAAGQPASPSATDVQGWLGARGITQGGGPGASYSSAASGSQPQATASKGCASKGNVWGGLPLVGGGISYCNVKAIVAGFTIAGGTLLGVIGIAFLIAATGRVQQAARMVPTPVSQAIGRVPGGGRRKASSGTAGTSALPSPPDPAKAFAAGMREGETQGAADSYEAGYTEGARAGRTTGREPFGESNGNGARPRGLVRH